MQERNCQSYEDLEVLVHRLEHEGKTVICVAVSGNKQLTPLGVLGLQDVLRPDAVAALDALRRAGITRIVMLTGDSKGVADAIAAEAGISEVHAGLMPEDKVRVIKEIAADTPVIMVGDGINDAPALAAANLGMAMGAAGTDVAMETADVVLMSHDMQQIPYFLQVSQKSRSIVCQNLVFASGVVVVLVIAALGFSLPLTMGVVGHEGSTVLVCLNGLRLLRPLRRAEARAAGD
jgi:Cd2+/Zn2+-exporting ATPase